MAAIDYPANFPFAELTFIVRSLKNGDAATKKADVAHAFWIVQGYGMAQAFGQPTTVISSQSLEVDDLPPSDDENIAQLEALLKANDPDNPSPQLLGIDWMTLLPIIAQLIAALLAKKQ